MSPKTIHALLIALSLACCACLVGCAAETDDTKSAQFSEVRGKCFATKVDLFLVYSETGRDYSITLPAGEDFTSDMPRSVEEYLAHPEKYGRHTGPFIVDIIPSGTHVAVTRKVDEHGSDGSLAFAKVIGGRYAGKEVGIWELLDDPDAPNSPTARINRYKAKPAYLMPVECGK